MFFDNQKDINIIINNNNNNKLVNPSIALKRGNIFNNEYKNYKNIEPKTIESINEKDNILLKIYELDFAITDLALYLDLNKDNNEIYKIYQDYVEKYKEYKKLYEQNNNILYQNNIKNTNYAWTNNPWPKENIGGIKYV